MKAAVLLIGVLTACAIAEIGARLWVRQRYLSDVDKFQSSPYKIEPFTRPGYRIHPNLSRTVQLKGGLEWSYTTNNRGWRGKAIPPRRNPDAKRVLFLGDSVTFGYGVADSETMPEQFASLWNQEAGSNCWIESLNLGVPGYNTIHELALLKEQFAVWQPDLVVLTYVLNDPEPHGAGPWRPDVQYRFVRSWFLEELKAELNETFFPRDHWFESSKYGNTKNVSANFKEGSRRSRESREALGQIAEFCAARNTPLILAIAPDTSEQLDARYPYKLLHDKVMSWAQDLDLPAVDLLEPLRATPSMVFSVPGDGHPNAAAHGRFARALMPLVKREIACE